MTDFGGEYVQSPPWSTTQVVPDAAIGGFVYGAVAWTPDGRTAASGPRQGSVTVSASLVELEVPELVTLVDAAPTAWIRVRGRYDDGVWREISSAEHGTAYESTAPSVVQVSPDGRLLAVEVGTAEILVRSGSLEATLPVIVESVGDVTPIDSGESPTGPGGDAPHGGSALLIQSVRPNPTSGPVQIRYESPITGTGTLTVYDVRGRRVFQTQREIRRPGSHVFSWDGRTVGDEQVPSGVYYLQIRVGRSRATTRLDLIR